MATENNHLNNNQINRSIEDELWEDFVESRKYLSDDFFAEGRNQGVQETREWDLFDKE